MSDEELQAHEAEHDGGDDQAAESEPPARDYESEARQQGWSEKEKWRGDPDKWIDAETFVRRGEEFLPIVQAQLRKEREANERKEREYAERLTRIESATNAAIKKQRETYERELKAIDARMAQAREDGDADLVWRLSERKGELNAAPPPTEPEQTGPQRIPEVDQWIEQNPWFLTNPEAQAVAQAAATRAKQSGATVAQELAAATDTVKRRFPELFPAERRTPAPASRAVDSGGSAAPPPGVKRGKGWSDIPTADRQAMERAFLRDDKFVQALGGPEKARAEMARDYWSE